MLHQLFVTALFNDLSAVHDDYLVGVFNRSDSLGNDDLGRIRYFTVKSLSDQGIRLGIDGTG